MRHGKPISFQRLNQWYRVYHEHRSCGPERGFVKVPTSSSSDVTNGKPFLAPILHVQHAACSVIWSVQIFIIRYVKAVFTKMECTTAREASKAEATILLIFDGSKGSGFSVQAPVEWLLRIPTILRSMADQIEADQ